MNGWRRSDSFFRGIIGFGLIIILGIAVIFVVRAFENASIKDFWEDESFALGTLKSTTYHQLFTRGISGQGSGAPLDYVFIKILDSAYQPFVSSIPHNIFYRMNSIFWDLIAGVVVALLSIRFLYQRRDDNGIIVMQLILISFALSAFYFKPNIFHFALEMRPYALWNSLWYVLLGLIMLRGISIWTLSLGVLLALTSSGALVQIPALALAQFFIRIFDKATLSEVLKETMLIFILPFFIAVYYALHIPRFTYISSLHEYQAYTHGFYVYWISRWYVPVLSGIGIFWSAWDLRWRGCAVVFITMLLLYFAAPVINAKILSNGFFFTTRQYLYHDLVIPLFCLMLAMVLPRIGRFYENT